MSFFSIFSLRPATADFIKHANNINSDKPKHGDMNKITKYIKCASNDPDKMLKFKAASGCVSALENLESYSQKNGNPNNNLLIRCFINACSNGRSAAAYSEHPVLNKNLVSNYVPANTEKYNLNLPNEFASEILSTIIRCLRREQLKQSLINMIFQRSWLKDLAIVSTIFQVQQVKLNPSHYKVNAQIRLKKENI